ncbi:UDP-glycosyltransferase 85A5-like protein [Carex littledalei]|uniref:Glycosyltransferase n=1 Tax=Carex littledalei TaxID=544730 RepID=A0A833QKR4_9POAL|nr:UDP-glycosyltransferase 85A5-like protein [Carex littledalei]
MALEKNTPHVLIFPYPSQGPLNCMMKLAELLAIVGLHVTVLNTEDTRQRLFLSSASLPAIPLLRFKSIPDGLPDDQPRDASLLIDVAESLNMNSRLLLRDLISEDSSDGFPPVTCLIVDGFLPSVVDLAEEIGLPCLSFRTPSACSIWAYLCIPKLLQNGVLPFGEGVDFNEVVQGVPGMEGFLRRRDLPEFFRGAKNADDPELKFMATVTAYSGKARGFILNTTEVLESTAVHHIQSQIPVTYSVGPLHAILESYRSACGTTDASPHTSSLWQEDTACLKWLDSQPDKSVVYVSFGSLTTLMREELHEFYSGLVNSGHKFLWVLRPDMIQDPGWTDEIKRSLPEEGRIISWAPQQKVLAHRAVGCFLTHSGWNSTLESIIEGVPMLCWPFFLDQQINSRFVSEIWRIGLDMKDIHNREVVEKMVRQMMEGESAARFRQSARDMADAVKESIAEGGSSLREFHRLIEDIKSMSNSVVLN